MVFRGLLDGGPQGILLGNLELLYQRTSQGGLAIAGLLCCYDSDTRKPKDDHLKHALKCSASFAHREPLREYCTV